MKYAPGATVVHEDLGVGKVLKCINNHIPDDCRLQGYRYYVRFDRTGHQTWSVPESSLFLTPAGWHLIRSGG